MATEMNQYEICSMPQHVWLLTERMVEHFLARLFLRNPRLRSLTLVSPFINTMADCRYSLADLSTKIKVQRTPTYVVTREPVASWQQEAVDLLAKNEWIEIRYQEIAKLTPEANIQTALKHRDQTASLNRHINAGRII